MPVGREIENAPMNPLRLIHYLMLMRLTNCSILINGTANNAARSCPMIAANIISLTFCETIEETAGLFAARFYPNVKCLSTD